MAAQRRILQIVGTAIGGEWFVRHAIELSARGYFLRAVVPGRGTVAESLEAAGIPVSVVPFKGRRLGDLARLPVAEWQLAALIRSFRPAIVHSHLFKAIVVGRVAARLGGVKHVSQWPGSIHFDVPLLRALDRATLPLDAVTLGSCQDIADRYRAIGVRSVGVAYYGLHTAEWNPGAPELEDAAADVRAELSIPHDAPLVSMVAHMYPTDIARFRSIGVKGHEVLIDAAAGLRGRVPEARFLIVGDELAGDGSYRSALEARAAAGAARDRVQFLGHRADVARLMAASDVIVVPSLRESASYAAMQSLLLRKPVVASRTGGLPDSVQDEETGLLVPPADAAALADAVERLIGDPAARARMGRLGRDRVLERFDVTETVSQLEDVYARLLSR